MTQKPPINADDIARIVMLAYGQMQSGGPFWCYVAVKPSEHERLKKVIASKKFDIRTYEKDGFGEIIVSGEGVAPPQDVTKKVAQMFNVPINKLFADIDPQKVITDEIQKLTDKQ